MINYNHSSLFKLKSNVQQPNVKARLIAFGLLLNCLGSLSIELTTPDFHFKSQPVQNPVIEVVKKLIANQ